MSSDRRGTGWVQPARKRVSFAVGLECDAEIRMKEREAAQLSSDAEDEIDRILRERGFRRLNHEEAGRLTEEEFGRLEEAYDVARAQEIVKAVREGRMEVVSGQELKEELDRICGRDPSQGDD